jgi:hypothetical protein
MVRLERFERPTYGFVALWFTLYGRYDFRGSLANHTKIKHLMLTLFLLACIENTLFRYNIIANYGNCMATVDKNGTHFWHQYSN